jgi:uncharacterized membrane protein
MSNKPTQEQYDAWTDDPENWRYSFFYYNPKDDRLLPPKRNRMLGWTINFANPKSIIVFAILLAAVVAILYLAEQV